MTDPIPTRREALEGLAGDLERLETLFAGWDEGQRRAVDAYRRAVDAFNGEALRRLIHSLRAEPAALAALKQAATDEVVYAVLRHHELIKPSLSERIDAALATVRPMLATHGGDVRLVNVSPPRVEIEMIGTCGSCASSAVTLDAGVKTAIQSACPEITEVVEVRGRGADSNVRHVSPFAVEGR